MSGREARKKRSPEVVATKRLITASATKLPPRVDPGATSVDQSRLPPPDPVCSQCPSVSRSRAVASSSGP